MKFGFLFPLFACGKHGWLFMEKKFYFWIIRHGIGKRETRLRGSRTWFSCGISRMSQSLKIYISDLPRGRCSHTLGPCSSALTHSPKWPNLTNSKWSNTKASLPFCFAFLANDCPFFSPPPLTLIREQRQSRQKPGEIRRKPRITKTNHLDQKNSIYRRFSHYIFWHSSKHFWKQESSRGLLSRKNLFRNFANFFPPAAPVRGPCSKFSKKAFFCRVWILRSDSTYDDRKLLGNSRR